MHKHLTENELKNFKDYYERCSSLVKEVVARPTFILDDLKVGDHVIGSNWSLRGLGYKILKINKKTVHLRGYGIKSARNSRHALTLKERIVIEDRQGLEFYKVSRSELALFVIYSRLSLRYGSYTSVENAINLYNQSFEYEQHENEQLDRYIVKYNLTKDCDCLCHTGPCWINYQRYLIERNAKTLRNYSSLCEYTFTKQEIARLDDLARELEKLERNNQHV